MAFRISKMNRSFTLSPRFFLTGIALLSVFASGCAHNLPSKDGPDSSLPAPKTLNEVLRQDLSRTNEDPSKAVYFHDNGKITVQGVELKNTRFDIPITINSRVEYWIDYFCGRGRGYFERYLERSEFFVPYIVPLLKQNGLPEDMVYLAMIESGFNNLARSRAKAVGPWQFISATGKRYGLMVNWWVDQRRSIKDSTLAAAEYLKDLHTMFQSWELAAAAYNAGEAKIARAIRRFGSKDFWVISKHRFLRPETRDYVPKIMAAAIISKNRTQFGFPESKIAPGAGEAVAADGEVVKLVKTDKPTEDTESKKALLKDLDDTEAGPDEDDSAQVASAKDESSKDSAKDSQKDSLKDNDDDSEDDDDQATLAEVAPANAELAVAENNKTGVPAPLAKPVPTPHVTKKGEVGGEELVDFEVQSPADLLKIARAAGLSYQTVKSLNPEVLRWCTPPTVGNYRIKLPAFTRDKFLATYNHEAFPRKVQFMTYKARKGETLTRIAHHFGIKVDPMSDLNGVSAKTPLRSGVRVLLPIPNDRSRTFASLEVRDPPEKSRGHRRRSKRHRSYKITYKNLESARSVGARAHLVDQEG